MLDDPDVAFGNGIALAVISAEWRYGNELRMIYVERMTRENPKMREISLPRLPNGRLLQADADSNYWNYVLKDYLGLDPNARRKLILHGMTGTIGWM